MKVVTQKSLRICLLCGASAVLAALFAGPALAQSALAQTVPGADASATANSADDARDIADIIVTGSRVVRPGYEQPTPTTTIAATEVQDRGITNITEILATIPAFNGSTNRSTNIVNGTGAVYLNLRALGTVRTLVLVDGNRIVPSAKDGTFDINVIPTIALERTDIVTGGASAAYGSDAVGGVVNLVTRHNYDGLLVQARGGVSSHGDAGNQNVGVLWGTHAGDDRIHLVVAAEYENQEGVGNLNQRAWARRNAQVVGGSLYEGINFSSARPGTFFQGPTSLGTNVALRADGTPYTVTQGTNLGGGLQSGGDNPTGYFTSLLPIQRPLERWSGLVNIGYDVSDSFRMTVGLLYGRTTTAYQTTPFITNGQVRIQPDNAFLPAGLTLPGPTLIGRIAPDLFTSLAIKNETYSGRVAFEGDLGKGWKWDVLGQYGVNKDDRRNPTGVILSNFVRAVDAVRTASGSVACRVNADAITTNDDPNCVPLNIFGVNRFSQQAMNYITAETYALTDVKRTNFAANLRGDIFSTWAGPVSVATGYEYRKDVVRASIDPVSALGTSTIAPATGVVANPGGVTFPQSAPINGKIMVNEVYAEAVVPLLKDSVIARSLDLNGAVRRAWYDPGSGVTTWKGGATWDVNDVIRLRGTISRDIRAPNVAELYSGGQILVQAVTNNPNQVTPTIPVQSGGNLGLKPERATTKSAGFSLKYGGAHLAADYYDIRLKGVIAAPGTLVGVVTNCLVLNVPSFCSLLTFNGRDITAADIRLTNVALRRATGVDFDIGYQSSLGAGNFAVNVLGTYAIHRIQGDAAGTIDYANVSGGGYIRNSEFATPRWLLYGTATYSTDLWGLTFNANYVSRSKTDPLATTTGATGNRVNIGYVAARVYFNLSGKVKVNDQFEFFGGIENLTDREPPSAIQQGTFGMNSSAAYYDTVGRRFFAGARARF